MIRFAVKFILIMLLFTACQVGLKSNKTQKLETREDKLSFYRGQIISFETDIDFHFKHNMDNGLKADYVRLEEALNGLSILLEKPEQESIVTIIQDMHGALENYKKTSSYIFFSRANDKIFTKLRKIKKIIIEQEKIKAKEITTPKVENSGKEK